jgi:hypothetical protein
MNTSLLTFDTCFNPPREFDLALFKEIEVVVDGVRFFILVFVILKFTLKRRLQIKAALIIICSAFYA